MKLILQFLWSLNSLIHRYWYKFSAYWQRNLNNGNMCIFCGAQTGKKEGTVLQQHRPRCRWLGPSNLYVAIHPNYVQMLAEDDVNYLPMLWAKKDLPKVEEELRKCKAKLLSLEAAHEKPATKTEMLSRLEV
jgi:hypothetical protein